MFERLYKQRRGRFWCELVLSYMKAKFVPSNSLLRVTVGGSMLAKLQMSDVNLLLFNRHYLQ